MTQANRHSRQPTPDQGTRVSVAELIRLRSEARRLHGSPTDTVSSLFPGVYRTLFKGRGIEFDETRGYQWGDDFRTLDWRVTARTGQLHTKLFQEERERTLYLLLDAGPTMQFGTRRQFKWVLAARVAALFAWLAVACGDRVGGALFGASSAVRLIPPGRGEAGVRRLFHLLAATPTPFAGTPSGPGEALLHLRRLAHPGSLILLLSDFSRLETQAREQLAYLGRHSEIAAIQIFDPLERSLPPAGLYPVTDGIHQALLDSRDPLHSDAYATRFTQRQAALRQLFNRYGARLISISTDQPLLTGLRHALRPPDRANPRPARRPGRP